MDEKSLLRGMLLDRARTRDMEYRLTHTHFLTPAQRADAEQIARTEHLYPGCFFYGGYPDAERTVCILAPDYIEAGEATELDTYFRQDPEDCPLCVIRAHKDAFGTLTHRDYLGALLGLGVKREMIGDLLVSEDGCDILALRQIAPYLAEHFTSAGHATLRCTVEEINTLKIAMQTGKEIFISVRSPRVDAILSSCFGLSRSLAAEAVSHGIVFVNSIPVAKPEKLLSAGDTITLRGKGKCKIRSMEGTTKSGRMKIIAEKY